MAAATTPIDTPERPGAVLARSVAAATVLFAGTLGASDGNGRAVPASDTAGLRVIGRVEETADNSAGGNDAMAAKMMRGTFRYANSLANPVLASGVDRDCFVEDNQTVASTTTHHVKAGRVVAVDAQGVWVDTTGATRVPSADTITGAADLPSLKTAVLAILQAQGLIG